jgi:hypothetical protein
MSRWICSNCKKSFKSKQNYDNHVNKTTKCVEAKYVCTYCNKRFTTKTSMYRHIRTVCKHKSDTDSEQDSNPLNEFEHYGPTNISKIYEMLIKMKEENEELRVKVTQMEKEPKTTTNNNTQNINNYGNINTGTVNNYYLVGYGKEDMSKIDRSDLLKGIRMGFNSTLKLIDTVHFNPKYPEFHNVYISSMKNKYAMMYDGDNWTLVMKEDLIDKMYDDKRDYIEENLEEFLDSLTTSQQNALDRWMNASDDHPYIGKIKNDIKLLLYNKRRIPLDRKSAPSIVSTTIEDCDDDQTITKQTRSNIETQRVDTPSNSLHSRSKRVIVVPKTSTPKSKSKNRFSSPAPRNGSKRKVIRKRRD